jgi:hypothetical protein
MSCKCQICNRLYKVDLIIPDDLWEKIKPSSKSNGAGMLCGLCIMDRIEKLDNCGAIICSENTIQDLKINKNDYQY